MIFLWNKSLSSGFLKGGRTVFLQDFHPVNQSFATKLKAERKGEKVSFSRELSC
jgi:hypothetical protein